MSDAANVLLIGSPGVGKTTYLATLLHYFDPTKRVPLNRLGITVELLDPNLAENEEDSREHWGNLLSQLRKALGFPKPMLPDSRDQSAIIEAANLRENVELFLLRRDRLQASPDIRNYRFLLRIPPQLLGGFSPKKIPLEVSDFAGEKFKLLDLDSIPDEDRNKIQECLKAKKWLLFLNDWEPLADSISKRRLKSLLEQIEPEVKKSLRIAVVMSKCERGELWSGRKEPEEDIFTVHLPDTHSMLQGYFREHPNRLKFFACSSFGVLGEKSPLPNRVLITENLPSEGYRHAVIRKEDAWKPYGLITPIVWLDTGRLWKWSHL